MIWTRKELKTVAKERLKKTYFAALLVSIIIAIVSISVTSNSVSYSGSHIHIVDNYGNSANSVISNNLWITNTTNMLSNILSIGLLGVVSVVFVSILILRLLFRIIIGYAVEVGGRKYFIETGEGQTSNLQNLAYGFRSSYKNITITMFKRGLFNLLWYFVLIVPGIIKSYAWRFVPYILADNPDMDSSAVLKLSEDMTRGHKINMFILDISFIGWYILGMLFFGIGQVLVYPYVDATNAQLYIKLRQNTDGNGFNEAVQF